MKICILKESFAIGGNERSASNFSKILADNNEIFVALFNAKNMNYTYSGVLYDFALPPRKTFLGKMYNSFLRSAKLKKLVRTKEIDIVYMFTRIGNYQTYAKIKNASKVISARDYASIIKSHRAYNSALKNSDAMICNSEYIKNYYLSLYPKDADKIFTVCNVCDAEEIIAHSKDHVEIEYLNFTRKFSKNICVVGRFCKEKGFEYLLKAFAISCEHSDLGLVMVGDGNLMGKYKDIIENLEIGSRVYFTGYQKNPYKYLARTDIFVLSSLSEGFPNVIVEAMSLGLPIISVNCYSGPAEILRDDSDYTAVSDRYVECDYGILTPTFTDLPSQNSISELARAIEYLSNNDALMKKYSDLSKKRVLEFSPDIVCKKIEAIFQTLIQRKRNDKHKS